MTDNYFTLSWHNLFVSVVEENKEFWGNTAPKKCILNNVSGKIKNKSLVAIMGQSGAGKTTLIAALSGRLKDKTGAVKINENTKSSAAMKTMSGYLYQTSIFRESLTVFEHITFMAALKLDKGVVKKRTEICDKLIQDLSLYDSRNTLIKVLSGGEKKRLALAVELLNDPDIIFCDEPTTGLDSYNALIVIEKLRDVALSGKLVIVTIHQPSVKLFDYFTHLIVLNFGEVLFQGLAQKARTIVDSESSHVHLTLSAESFMKTGERMSSEEFENSNNNSEGLKECLLGYIHRPFSYPKSLKVYNSLFVELRWLIWREYLDIKRNFLEAVLQFGMLMISALVVSTIYMGIGVDEHIQQNVSGLLYFLTTELLFTHVYVVINTFPSEFGVFLREKELYSGHSYYISKIISMLPRNYIQPSVYLAVVFILLSFMSQIMLYLKMSFVLFVACTTASLLGLCISAHFTSVEYMDLFLVPFDAFSLIITGVVLNIPALPNYVVWMKYLSPFSFTFESLAILQWTNINNTIYNVNGTAYVQNGATILQELGYPTDEISVVWDLLCLFILSVGLGVFGYLGLLRKKYKYCSY